MAYVAEYQRPYEGGYVDLPDESTPEMAAFINARDDALLKIEQFLATLDLSGLGSDYALLSEAGYSLGLDIDSNYIMTISLKNKADDVLSSKQIDFPIESVVVNATYENGKITLTLQNGNTLPIDISDMVRGLVPTTRTIAGIDLADDITKEELKKALELGGGGNGDIAGAVSAGEIKPWLYDDTEEVIIGVYNGKPLYRKSFVISVTCNQGQMVEYNLSDYVNNVDVVINYNAYGDPGDELPYLYLDGANQAYSRSVVLFSSIGKIRFSMSGNSSYNNKQVLFIIEYTKTTDAEGSGNGLRPYGIYDAKLDELAQSKENIAITETTETTMLNSHDGRVKIEKIGGGESEQFSTSGKNLLQNTATTTTKTDVTFTVNTDGTVSAKGTAGETRTLVLNTIKLPKGNYLLSGNSSNTSSYIIRLTIGEVRYTAYDTDVPFTVEDETLEMPVTLYVFKDQTVNNDIIYPMIRLASVTDGTYEPYTNGASPNPSYPQEIKKSVVSGIKTHGPQCFNIGSASFLINGVSATDVIKTKSGVEFTTAVLGANVGVYTRETFNGEYTVSMDVTLSDNNFTNFVINSKMAIKGDDYTANTKRHVVIQNTYNNKSITMYLDNRNKAVGTRVVIENIMVTKGSVELPYEEYKRTSITLSNPIDLYGIGDVQDVIEGGKISESLEK